MLLPERRTDGLIATELDDEVLLYDLERHRAYCLNRTTALVWNRCDGHTTLSEAIRDVEVELGVPAGEDLVRFALERLDRAHLLRERLPKWMTVGLSRREFAKRMALVGAIAFLVPTVASILAPTAAHALTCINVSCRGRGEV